MAVLADPVQIFGSPVITDLKKEAFIVVETGNEFVHLIRIEVMCIILDEINTLVIVGRN